MSAVTKYKVVVELQNEHGAVESYRVIQERDIPYKRSEMDIAATDVGESLFHLLRHYARVVD